MISTVTAYVCWSMLCKNAAGITPKKGDVACRRSIPLHTKVSINGHIYECHDRTAKHLDGRYDVFLGFGQSDYDRAIKFGKKRLEVKILK